MSKIETNPRRRSRLRPGAAQKRRLLLLATTVAGVTACSGAASDQPAKLGTVGQALNTAPKIGDFAIYAQRSAVLGASDTVTGGDIGVRATAPSSFGPQVKVGSLSSVQFGHDILAPSVSLTNAQVGNVQTNSQTNNGVDVFGTQAPFPAASMPPLPVVNSPAAGSTSVTVPAFTVQSLNPGTYGALSVTGTLALYAGTYTFTNVNLATFAHFAVQTGPVVVNVTGTFTAGQGVTILPPLGQAASNLTINVAGSDASASSPAVSIGINSTIDAILAAPHGTVSFANGVTATGAFSGYDVVLGDHVSLTFQNGFVAATANPRGSQQLSGYVTSGITAAPVVGPVPASTPMHVSVGLPGRNPSGLAPAVQAVSDPINTSQYRHYLTPSQFADQFGATTSDYNLITAWAQANGLTVKTYPNRLLVSVSGTAGALEKALFVNFEYRLRPDGTQFFAPDQEPSLNAAPTVLRISGTDTLLPTTDDGGTSPTGNYTSNDLRKAYLPCTTLDGTGQFIGIFGIDGFVKGDLDAYEATISGTHSFPISTVLIDGFDGNVTGRHGVETIGDLESAISLAPGAELISFEGPDDKSLATDNDILTVMATNDPLPLELTNSYVFPVDGNTQNIVNEMALQGQSFFQSSGDSGQYTSDPKNRRDLLNVTVVGGTVLTTDGTQSYVSETTWSGSGGAILPSVSIPWYQQNFGTSANGGSTQFRMVPDVAFIATGIAGKQGGDIGITGTSFASPRWAGITALINEQGAQVGLAPVGFLSPALYNLAKAPSTYASSFHDINDNSTNPSSDGTLAGFSAITGYDLATGLGTPSCGLINVLNPDPNQGPPNGGGNPPPPPSITVGSVFTQEGPTVCTTGSGFTPGALVTVNYAGIPGGNAASSATGTVLGDGTFIIRDTSAQGHLQNPCDVPDVNFESVYVTAVDGVRTGGIGTGRTVTASRGLPASIYCPNDPPQPTIVGAGCPP